jgi:hypothetical protein
MTNDEGSGSPNEKTNYGSGLSSFVINSDFADLNNLRRRETMLMKSIIVNVLIILAATAGVTLLLKKGGDAGARKVKEVTAPVGRAVVDATPIHPLVIEGQLDNFAEPIELKPIQSWGADPKHGFMLAVSANPKLNQPSARVVFAYPIAASTVLDIEYTVPQNLFEIIEADPAARDRFDGVAVQATTQGAAYNTSALLKLDPKGRPEQRKWLFANLILPPATREVHFWIVGIPPDYNVFWANCVISLPQVRVTPTKVPAARDAKSSSTTENP